MHTGHLDFLVGEGSIQVSCPFFFLIFFFNVYLFLGQRETEHEVGKGQRETETESEAGSRL